MKKRWFIGAFLALLMLLVAQAQAEGYTCISQLSITQERIIGGCGKYFTSENRTCQCNADHIERISGNGDGTHSYTTYHKYSNEIGDWDTVIVGKTESCSLYLYECTATCTKSGYNIYRCSGCGSKYRGAVVGILGHDYSEEWTGTSNYMHYRYCTRDGCKSSISEYHSYAPATCISYSKCVCGVFKSSEGYGPHRYDGERTTVTAATCTQWGEDLIACSVCEKAAIWVPVEPLDHKEVADAAVAATCTTDGKTAGSYCSSCGTVLVAQETIPAGHKEVADAEVAATCTTDGKTAGSHCSSCGTVLVAQETIPAGHKEVADAEVAATCTTDGKTAGSHCSACGTVLVAQETIPGGHKEVADTAVEPGCENTGLTAGAHCSVCGDTIVAQEIIQAKGHSEVITPAVAASCTATGKTAGKTCSVCGVTLAARQTIPAKGHFYGDWTPAGEYTHETTCTRAHCTHVNQMACTRYEVLVNEEIFSICPICGEYPQGIFEISAAVCENAEAQKSAYGEWLVRLLKTPFGAEAVAIAGLEEAAAPLYALTVVYEAAGQVRMLEGVTRVMLEMEIPESITLLRLDGETWTEIPCTVENGVLSFETDQFGLFLLMPAE